MKKQTSQNTVVLVCFAFAPGEGSEPGVGWNWALQLAKTRHVVVVTEEFFRSSVQQELRRRPIENLEVIFYAPRWASILRPEQRVLSRIYYTAWQIGLRLSAETLFGHLKSSLSYVHALTWGTFRFPCLLTNLGRPLVVGPVGGAERAPMRFLSGLPISERLLEFIRDSTISLTKFDPLVRLAMKRADLVLCKTDETRDFLGVFRNGGLVVAGEIGATVSWRTVRESSQRPPIKLLFAGRLVGWKGVHILLDVAGRLSANGVEFQLNIAGAGRLYQHLDGEIKRRNLGASVRLLGRLRQEALFDEYQRSDLFVFPSLHDSSGNVVLEALAHGLPVLCLDLGGPKNYVNESCGYVAPTTGKTVDQIAADLAHIISAMTDERLASWCAGAYERAARFTWDFQVTQAQSHIESTLGLK